MEDLLARSGKDGRAQVRGPLASVPFAPGDKPLENLADGDKLHIVRAEADDAARLVELLGTLGLNPQVRLRQIHLLIDNAGVGDAASFAESFSEELLRRGYRVLEIKAPRGRVRWDGRGKVYIAAPQREDWVPSSSELNYYTGPGVQEKHRAG